MHMKNFFISLVFFRTSPYKIRIAPLVASSNLGLMLIAGIFTLSAFVFVFMTFASHVYEIVNRPLWDRSFRDYIRCDANITILEKLHVDIEDPAATKCVIAHRPNIAVMKVNFQAFKSFFVVLFKF